MEEEKKETFVRPARGGGKTPWWKKIIFSLIPLLLVFVLAEIILSIGYYYKNKGFYPATFQLIKSAKLSFLKKQAEVVKGKIPPDVWRELYGEEGKDLLASFEKEYDENFGKLVEECAKIKAQPAILYIPSPGDEGRISRDESRRFFLKTAEKYGVPFLDVTNEFLKYPEEWWSLLPANGHLSRFGNQILSDYLAKYFGENDYRSDFRFDKRPERLGDLLPNNISLGEDDEQMVYRSIANRQGFRNNFDLEFPKSKQRVLFLGDSFTYGPYLPNSDTYPEILNKLMPNKEFINAGFGGYTITDELSLFVDRAKYSEPDIVVVQALDNDLYGLMSFKQNSFDREKKVHEPSQLEKDFLEKIKK